MPDKMSKTEITVITQLELDSRMPFSAIGKRIKKSQQVVSYTVNSLIKKEVILNFYPIIDYSKLGIISFRVYFRVNYINEARFKELINHFVKDPHTSWVATCGGRYDLICIFMTENPSQFNKTLKSIMARFPDQLSYYNVLTTIVIRGFGRKYLFKGLSKIPVELFVGGDRKPVQIDDIDMKILKKISEDARVSSVSVANSLSVTPGTVISRIKNLRDREIILGYKPLLHIRKYGFVSWLILIQYHNVSVEAEERLINYLKVHPDITHAVKTLGEWDLEIEAEAKSSEELRVIEREIREKFALLIREVETIPLYKSYKKSFFPKFLIGKGK